jgi:hypothetical protein
MWDIARCCCAVQSQPVLWFLLSKGNAFHTREYTELIVTAQGAELANLFVYDACIILVTERQAAEDRVQESSFTRST